MGRAGVSDSTESSEKSLTDRELTVSDYLVASNGGYYDYHDTTKPVPHVGDGSDTEKTESASSGDSKRTESTDHMEVDSGLRSGGDKTENIIASDGQWNYMEADSRHGRVNQVVRSHAEGANLNIAPLQSLEQRKNGLDLPRWFKELAKKSDVTGIDGWKHFEIIRNDSSVADKFFTHRDYRHTFRSEPEVVRFLATGEVKKKGIWQKLNPLQISADPSGQNPGASRASTNNPQGASRATKRKAVPEISTNNPQGSGCFGGGKGPISRELREQGWL